MVRTAVVSLLSAALVIESGCASVKVQRDRADAVKSVAIIGFTGVTELEDKNAPKSGVGDLMNAVSASKDVFGGELDARRIAQAEQTYQLLQQHLQAATGWKVADRKQLDADAQYGTVLKENPNTDSMRVMGLQRLPDVLRYEVAQQMDAKARAELCQRLGVDAVAVAKVRYVIGDKSGFSMGGMGSTTLYPKAIVEFAVLDGNELPVWQDRWAEGKPTKEGLQNIMGARQNQNETQVLVAAAGSAFDTLVERYQPAPAK